MTLFTAQPDTVGLLDGRYQVHERVGEGGMAAVYRAEDTLLARTVAIKLLKGEAEVLASPVRAHREVSALARLNHPSLVTLLDANLMPGGCRYIVMEYVDGPNLSRFLSDGPLSTAQTAHLARELASGLAAVHAAGLVHRDVKPSNVLIAPAVRPGSLFRVKLADFGLAQLADATSVTTPGMVTGTAAYLAPEQVRGEASSAASDIYALGLVLLEALTGERAFRHASGIGAVMARLLESPAIPGDIEPGWTELVGRMILMDPTGRPTALEVIDAVSHLPTTATRPAPTAVLPSLPVIVADTAPVHARTAPVRPAPVRAGPVRPTPSAPAERLRRRPHPRTWIGASVAASFVAIALTFVPGFVAGSSAEEPSPRLIVDRVAKEAVADPVESPATVEVVADTASTTEAVDPAPVAGDGPGSDKVKPAPKAEKSKPEPKGDPKAQKKKADKAPAGGGKGKPGARDR